MYSNMQKVFILIVYVLELNFIVINQYLRNI